MHADSNGGGASPTRIEDVVCGFCGLGCDDLAVEVSGRAIRSAAGVCPEAARLLTRLDEPDPVARIRGAPADPEAAYAAAAQLLAGARAPVIAGLGADVEGGRALVDLAIRHGGVLDHAASDGQFANYAAAQRTGWLTTTLAEVRNHCDVMLVVGPDPTHSYGRFFERAFAAAPLFAGTRRVIFLGGAPGARAQAQLSGVTVTALPATDPVAALAALAQFVSGPAPMGEAFGGVPAADLAEAAAALTGAAYGVATWSAATLLETGIAADLVAERATRLVDALNRTTRAGVFPLGGRDNIVGINQMMLWRIGYPLRTALAGDTATHDPDLYATRTALADADLLVWVNAFRPEPPPAFDGPVIVLGAAGFAAEPPPDVYLPVATPGIDHAGTVFRMDSVVSLPLGALRVATLPSVAEAVRRLMSLGAPAVRRAEG